MNNSKLVNVLAKGFIILSAISLLWVSLMAFKNPQAVMDLVSVRLDNTDAISSIRGVYGGLGLAIFILLVSSLRRYRQEALFFLVLLWGLYAASRLITIFSEGQLGSFGRQWLIIESFFFVTALTLFLLARSSKTKVARVIA